jgi:hypothetical protein
MTMEKHEADVIRHLASVLESSEARLYEQVAISFRWLIGTLFAANGGAILMILGSESIAPKVGLLPLVLFAVGMLCSIFMSLTGSLYAAIAAKPLNELRTLLAMNLATGQLTPNDVEQKTAAMSRSTMLKWPLFVFEFASIATLIAGLVLVGLSLAAK